MDDSGAEALEDHEINEIPKVVITEEQWRNSLQCTVCLDYFKVNEEAKVLPCNHHFHEGCIDPWLVLRGTCPDCRRNLVPDTAVVDTELLDIDEETLSGYESAHSNMIPSYVTIVSYDRFIDNDAHIYDEDIDNDEEMTEEVIEDCTWENSEQRLNDVYSQSMTSHDITMTTRSPETSLIYDDVVNVDDWNPYKRRWRDSSLGEASGSTVVNVVEHSVNDVTIPSSPSAITVSDATGEEDPSDERCVLSEISSDITSIDRMSIESELLEEISISSTDLSMQDD